MMRSRRLDPLLKVVQERQDTAARQVAERDRVRKDQNTERLVAKRAAGQHRRGQQAGA